MTMTTVRIKPELDEPLEMLAKKLGVSKDSIINQAVMDFIAQQELAERRWQETLPALDSMKAGRGVPADKVFEWMRSWGTENEVPRPK